jgi:integrase/recombinase XerD
MYWSAKIISHNGEKRIAVYFEKSNELISRIRKVEGARWSQTLKVWHIPNTVENQIRFSIVVNQPSKEGLEQIEKFKQWLISKRYSSNTIKTYTEALRSFLTFFNQKSKQ